MRLSRISFIFLAFFITFVSGTYYFQLFPLRIAHHVILSLCLVFYSLWAWRRGGLPDTSLTLPLLLTIPLWLLTSALSVDPRVSLENAWFPITHVVIAIFLIDLVRRGRDKLVIEVQFMLAAIVMMFALIHLGSWYFGWDVVPGTSVGWADVTAVAPLPLITPMIYMPLGVSTWLAAYVAPLILIAFGYGLAAKQRPVRIGFWILAGGLLIALIGTFSRGGFVALAAGISIFVGLRILNIVLSGLRENRSKLALPVIFAVVTVALVLTIILLLGRNVGRFTGDALRLNLWRGAIEVAADHPVVGVGTGLFGRVFREYREPNVVYDDRLGTAHNAYLNTFAENGVFGIALMLVLAIVIVRAAWQRWRKLSDSKDNAARLRLEATFAGLAAFGAQSMFDTFVIPPLALLLGVLVVLVAIEPGRVLEKPQRNLKWAAAALAVLMSVYGVGQLLSDSTYGTFRQAPSLQAVRSVAAADPNMGLYELQIAYLAGQQNDPNADDAYTVALEHSPTWDIGWINRAALAEQNGDIDIALEYLEQARDIDVLNAAAFNWARIAEASGLADDEAILDSYAHSYGTLVKLPLSGIWAETPLRRTAIDRLVSSLVASSSPDIGYRIAQVQLTEQLEDIVQKLEVRGDQSAAALWIYGEHALAQNDAEAAFNYFDRAAQMVRISGDYYASRARARAALDPTDPLIETDLRLAELLTTVYEVPNAIRAEIAPDLETQRRLWASAVPLQVVSQNFEALSFGGRVVGFTPYPSMREPGPGTTVLQPWYDMAQSYLDTGETDRAITVYQAILANAPEESLASEQLSQLTN